MAKFFGFEFGFGAGKKNGKDDCDDDDHRGRGDRGRDTPVNFIGTQRDDRASGTRADDFMDGREGADQLDGGAGDDTILGGKGKDKLSGGDGDDFIDGGDDDDQIDAGDGDDLALGGKGKDKIAGGKGDDYLDGGDGDDELDGGSGDDILIGGAGKDTLIGGGGDDELHGGDGDDKLDGGDGRDVLTGDKGADKIFGGKGDDFIDGGAGNDQIDGGEDEDIIIGGDGDDKIDAGKDDDIIIEGRGSDQIEGGRGADTVIYYGSYFDFAITVKSKDGPVIQVRDLATGDVDTLRSVEKFVFTDVTLWADGRNNGPLTRDDKASVREDVSPKAQGNVLTNDSDPEGGKLTVKHPGTYALTYGTLTIKADGTFKYELGPAAQSLAQGQTVEEKFTYYAVDSCGDKQSGVLTICVTGTNDAPKITGASASATVFEDGVTSAAGAIAFCDVDLTDTHTVTVAPQGGGYLGALTASISNPSTGDGAGVVGWTFNVSNAALQFLAQGQTLTQKYNVTITDPYGAAATQVVTITIKGANDAPVITGAAATGAVAEDGATTAAGTIDFADVDLTDSHGVTITPQGGGYLGALSASVSNAATGDGVGQVSWGFSVNNAALQFLAQGQTLTQTYNVKITDPYGASATQTVTITITGTNDAPVITGAAAAGAVAEDGATTAAGTIDFTDVDLADSHGVSITPQGGGYLGVFSAVVSDAATGDGVGQLSWGFSVDNAALQFLAQGQVLTQKYNVTVFDPYGGAATQVVTVTITGTNDAPVITGAVAAGAVAEDGVTTAAGTIDFADVDLTDVHGVGITPQGGGYLGVFAAGVTDAATGDGVGQLSWSFSVNNAALQFLAEGQTLTQKYDVKVSDPYGGVATQTVTITLTGANDAPVITGAVSAGAVVEDGVTTAAGTIDFTDADLSDSHGVTVTPQGGPYLGLFSAGVTDAATGDGAGQVSWNFAVDNAALQFLAQGQVLTQKYDVAIADGFGGVATQVVTVTITGTNDAPVITGAVATGAVVEDGITTTGGTIDFADVDLTDSHGVSITPQGGGYLGIFSAGVTDAATGDGVGQLTWGFSVNNAALQFLAQGQVLTQVYDVSVQDPFGGVATQAVTVTITGTNDAPVITGAVATGAVVEDGATTTGGTIDFADVDLTDSHGVSITPQGGGYLGIFSAGVTDAATGDGVGQLTWSFAVDNAALQFLAEGQVLTQVYDVSVQDPFGGVATQAVTVTITGTNDAPVITGAVAAGAVTEDGVTTAAGTIDFADVDLADVHGVVVTPQGGLYLGELTASVTNAATGDGAGQVSWDFTVDNALLQFLAEGQTLTQDYVVAVVDGEGGVATQTVTITLTGTNDAPLIVAAIDSGAITEDGVTSTGGNILFTDVDLTDGHTVGAAPQDGGYLGVFSAVLSDPATGGATGNINWNFTVDNAALQFLAQDQTLTQYYDVTIDDGHGGAATQTVEITLTGVNDAPVFTGGSGANFDGADVTFRFLWSFYPAVVLAEGSATVGAGTEFTSANMFGAGGNYGDAFNIDISGTTLTVTRVDGGGGWASGDFTGFVILDLTDNLAEIVGALTSEPRVTVTFDADALYVNLADSFWAGGETFTIDVLFGVFFGANVFERADGAADENTAVHSAGGVITFEDVDLLDTHTASATAQGPDYRGTFSVSVSDDSTGDGSGEVSWTFEISDADIDDLAVGQTLTQYYDVTVDDGHGGTDVQTVTVFLVGANDAPTISGVTGAGVTEGAVAEDGANTAAGVFEFADVDLADGHAVWAIPQSGPEPYLGFLSVGVNDASTGDGAGSIWWSFYADPGELQALGAGEVRTQTYEVTIDDGHGGTATQIVTITLTGENDAPVATDDVVHGPSSVFLNFDDLPASAPIPTGYGGFDWYADTTSFSLNDIAAFNYGNSLSTPNVAIPWYGPANTFIERTDGGTFTFDSGSFGTQWDDSVSPITLVGYVGGVEVSSYTFTPASEPGFTFIAPGLGVIDKLEIRSTAPGWWRLDDATFTLTGSPVPFDEDVAAVISSGTLLANDYDIDGDALSIVSVSASSTLGATLTLGVGGDVTYDPTSSAGLAALAAGETTTDTFTYTISDGQGGFDTATVTVTVLGANDGPVFGAGVVAGAATEIADLAAGENVDTHTATGAIAFSDADLSNTHTVSVTPQAVSGYLGALTAVISDAATGDGAGEISWSFSVADADLDFLAAGETRTQYYDITVDDGEGGTATQTVTITITGANDAPVIEAAAVQILQSFEADTARVLDADEGWYGSVTQVPSGTNGVTSPDGASHVVIVQGGPSGDESAAFSRFDGYRSSWPGDWSAEVKVYLDTAWSAGEGFDYSVAASGSDGGHQRDFIFHVAKDTSSGALIVAGSNNTNFDPREDLDTLANHYVVPASGWYTLQHVFRDNGGVLAVDLNLIDSNGDIVFTETRSDPGDTIPAEVGGNRYGWFTNIDIAGGLAVDALTLNVPGAASYVAEIVDGSPDENNATLVNTGTIDFYDVDVIDSHSVSVTPQPGADLGTFSAAVTTPAAGGTGQVSWSFSVADADLDALALGETKVQQYDVTVDDGQGGTATQTVTITITGANDAPMVTGGVTSGAVFESGDIAGVDEAGLGGGFEPAFAVATDMSVLLTSPGSLTSVLADVQAELGGDQAKAIAAVWDYLDDIYVSAGPNQINVNEAFVRLSAVYAAAAQTGALHFIDVTAKYTPDGGDAGSAPDRQQSLHDNLLGNLSSAALNQRFGAAPALEAALTALVSSVDPALLTRPYFSGNEGASDAAVRAWDVANGYVPGATGALSASDVDNGASLNWSISGASAYGTMAIDAGTGTWTYQLDDALPATQALAQGQIVVESFTATVTDQHGASATQLVSITITGTNDAPVITGGVASATLFESGDLDNAVEAHQVANFKFEPGVNLDSTIAPFFTGSPIDMALLLSTVQSALGPDAGPADAIAAVWDYIDDNYSYYNNLINEGAVRLGLAYADYLEAGGRPLTDVIAKYAPDGGDAGTDPDRQQSLHDNILGNLHGPSMMDKFLGSGSGGSNPSPVPALYAELVALIDAAGLTGRPIYGGYEGTPNDALAWDIANGLIPVAAGTLTATDVDAGAVLTWSGDAAGVYGSFGIDPVSGAWTYSFNDAAASGLAEGESAVESFTATVTDEFGGFDTLNVVITIQGANDAPVKVSADTSGSAAEDGVTAASGVIAFTDADLSDFHTASVTPHAGGYLGALTASVTDAATGDNAGEATWSFSVDNAELQFLAQGQTINQKYNVAVTDNHGATFTQVVTITLTGANDAPVITGGVASATLFEGGDLDAVTEAHQAANFRFEPHYNVDAVIAPFMASPVDMGALLAAVQAALPGTAGPADAIAAVWDYIDDNYSYYNNVINEAAVRLGLAYADYIEAGGRPLTDVIAKYTPDGADAGTAPDRLQSLHDNILGNLHGPSMTDKLLGSGNGGSNAAPISLALFNELVGLIDAAGLTGRPIYSGNENAVNDALAFDIAHGLIPAATGTLSASDVDTGAVLTWSGDAAGTYGDFVIDPGTGTWSYTLDDSRAATDALAEGQTVTESFTATVTDEFGGADTQTITITIKGTNDAPVISGGVTSGAVAESGDIAGIKEAGSSGGLEPAFAVATDMSVLLTSPGSLAAVLGGVQAELGGNLAQAIAAVWDYLDDIYVSAGPNQINVNEAFVRLGLAYAAAVQAGDLNFIDVVAKFTPDGADAGSAPDRQQSLHDNLLGNLSSAALNQRFGAAPALEAALTALVSGVDADLLTRPYFSGNEGASDAAVRAWDVANGYVPAATGTLTAHDVDTGASLNWSISGASAYGAIAIDAGTGTWTYQLNDALPATQALAAGQSVVETFTATATDEHGATDTQTVSVTITGTNDAPVIGAATASGVVVEDGAVSTGGAIAFGDVDLADTHSVASSAQGVGYLGAFSAGVSNAATGDGAGEITWSYSVDNALIQHLAEGQTLVQTYEVAVTDNHGATATQVVTVTITGDNDQPQIGASASGMVQSFETDKARVLDASSGWQGAVTVVPDGTNGIAAPDGASFAIITQGGAPGSETGAFTRFDAYRSAWPGDWTASALVYLDTGWAVGEGFDYSVAASGSDGAHQRDFIFHVTKDSSTGQLLVGASNNTNFAPREDLETLANHGEIAASGWYRLEHNFKNNGGVLAVELNVYDANDVLVFSQTLSDPSDTIGIGGQVGGNRYGWFTNIDVAGGIAVDAISLSVPGGTSYIGELTDGSPEENAVTLVNTGTVAFTDVDLLDVHTVTAVPLGGPYLGTMTAALVDPATGGATGLASWTFEIDDAAIDHLAAGQQLAQSYAIRVEDNHGAFHNQIVTVVITGTNDAPTISSSISSGAVAEDGAVAATGTISFADVDLANSHVVGVTPQGGGAGYLGALTASVTNTATGDGVGQVTWNYAVDNSVLQYLAAGQTLTQLYDVTITDTHGGFVTKTVTITIAGANDAPVLDPAPSPTLPSIAENVADGANTGTTVAALVGASITDVDAGALEGVAVTGRDNANGEWQYKLASGGGWTAMPALSAASALLLGPSDMLRFVPDNDYNGPATFTFRAWDQSAGSAGGLADTTINGGSSAYSSVVDTASIDVAAVNDAPEISIPATYNTLLTLDYPGGPDTTLFGINDAGVIVGGAGAVAFEYAGGAFTALAVPDSNGGAAARAINNNDVIVGYYSPGAPTPRYSFVEDGGAYTTGYSLTPFVSTTINGINDAGKMVGAAYLHGSTTYASFLDVGGVVTYFYAPGEGPGTGGYTFALDINNLDQAVGWFDSPGAEKGFFYDGGVFTTLAHPLGTRTQANGLNDQGQIVGWYHDAGGLPHGFVYEDGVYTTIDNPLGVNGTGLNGVNEYGQFVGWFIDAGGVQHGFTGYLGLTTAEDTTLAITSISMSDIDAGAAPLLVTLAVDHGAISLASTAGLALLDSDGSNGTLSFVGSLAAINAALTAGVNYTPATNYNGPDALTVTVNDQGAAGAGGPLTDVKVLPIQVTPVNDAAVFGGASNGSVTEDSVTSVSGTLTVSDVDPGQSSFQAGTGIAGTYGTLNINAAGNWTYFLNNAHASVQALNNGDTLTDTVTVYCADGTAKNIDITINGANEGLSASILFVDDDAGMTTSSTWTSTLDLLGVTYTYEAIAVDGNPVNNLDNFDIVIWSIGDRAYSNLTAQNVTALTSFLNGGGALLYAGGHNLYEETHAGAFIQQYLGLSNFQYNMPYFDQAAHLHATGAPGSYTLSDFTDDPVTSHYAGTMISAFQTQAATATMLLEITSGGAHAGHPGYATWDPTYNDIAAINIAADYRAATWGFDLTQLDPAFRKAFLSGTLQLLNGAPLGTVNWGGGDPIVLDLNGDGVRFSATARSFDLDGDGVPEATAWAESEDGVLAVDVDNSGAIEDGSELISPAFNGLGFGDSFEALRSFDSTIDGVIDSRDVNFSSLKVWRDRNGDGVSQADELASLSDLGIASISLDANHTDVWVDGQHVFASGSFAFADGGNGAFVAVNLRPGAGDAFVYAGGADDKEPPPAALVSPADPLTADTFIYAAPSSGEGEVTDFTPGLDKIEISAAGFGGGLSAGGSITLISGANPAPSGAGGQFLYDNDDGHLYWDPDGNGAQPWMLLATLSGAPTLTSDDFIITP